MSTDFYKHYFFFKKRINLAVKVVSIIKYAVVRNIPFLTKYMDSKYNVIQES